MPVNCMSFGLMLIWLKIQSIKLNDIKFLGINLSNSYLGTD